MGKLFVTKKGKITRLTLDDPKKSIDPAAVKQSMDQIITAGTFFSPNGNFVSAQGAQVIERSVTNYEIA